MSDGRLLVGFLGFMVLCVGAAMTFLCGLCTTTLIGCGRSLVCGSLDGAKILVLMIGGVPMLIGAGLVCFGLWLILHSPKASRGR